jgi:elongation factor P
MFNTNDIKNGITFLYEDNIYQVLDFLHVKPGKGAAFVKAKIKNLRTGSIVEKTFNTSIKLEKAMIVSL